MVLKLKVINQGFITAPLRATLVETAFKRVTLYMDSSKLSGEPQDTRLLHLIPERSGLFDVTIAFSIDSNVGDLGGRDRIHLLVRCENRS